MSQQFASTRPQPSSQLHSHIPLRWQVPNPYAANGLPRPKRRKVSQEVEGSRTTPKALPPTSQAAGKRRFRDSLRERARPYITAALRGLEQRKVQTQAIIDEINHHLEENAWFRIRWDETRGRLTPSDEREIEKRAFQLVAEFSLRPEYQLQASLTSTSAPPVSQIVIDGENRGDEDGGPYIPTRRSKRSHPESSPIQQVASIERAGREQVPTRRKPRRPAEEASIGKHSDVRPYRTSEERRLIARAASTSSRRIPTPSQKSVYHVDFTRSEIAQLVKLLNTLLDQPRPETIDTLRSLVVDPKLHVPTIAGTGLPGRTPEDVRSFCNDLLVGVPYQPHRLRALSVKAAGPSDLPPSATGATRASRMSTALFARELVGQAGFGRTRTHMHLKSEFQTLQEDDLHVVAEYTDCAGDIATASWAGNGSIVCGTTAHSDSHNQQYNKAGNLLLCSMPKTTLRAFPDHRIPRPLIEKGDNSTAAMRYSQSPWLYSSVVSSDFDDHTKRSYTSSFDHTVKIWRVAEDANTMECQGTWHHAGNVNFVAAARDGSGRVATAADVPKNAIRIYSAVEPEIEYSPYREFSCSRKDADHTKWAYYPSTMQWGKAPGTQHLLLVGYSPRSLTGDEQDIPEERRKSGEIVLIDADKGELLPIMNATTTNIFEVVWHPYHPCFIAGTSPVGLEIQRGTRTQVHIFHYDHITHAFTEKQNIDCPASDINELTIMPNSRQHSYITAACTNGMVYVWDTAHPERPLQLTHGQPVDPYIHNREEEDTGVKFTAWGRTPHRFYTGGSDGVVRVWDVRNGQKPYIKTLLKAPGPVSCGSFSPDFTKLAIGDATGRLHILSVSDVEGQEASQSNYITIPGTNRRVRRPKPCLQHPEPPPPTAPQPLDPTADTVREPSEPEDPSRAFLNAQQLVLHPNPTIGAVQGPAYAATGLFRNEAHADFDPSKGLTAIYERNQQESINGLRGSRLRSLRRLPRDLEGDGAVASVQTRFARLHLENRKKDLDPDMLDRQTLEALTEERAELQCDEVDLDVGFWDFPWSCDDEDAS